MRHIDSMKARQRWRDSLRGRGAAGLRTGQASPRRRRCLWRSCPGCRAARTATRRGPGWSKTPHRAWGGCAPGMQSAWRLASGRVQMPHIPRPAKYLGTCANMLTRPGSAAATLWSLARIGSGTGARGIVASGRLLQCTTVSPSAPRALLSSPLVLACLQPWPPLLQQQPRRFPSPSYFSLEQAQWARPGS